MKKTSDLTCKVIAFQALEIVTGDDCVDWAYEMIYLGHETPSLLMLASFNKPADQREVRSYVEKSFSELNLQLKTGENAIISYCSYYIQKIAHEQNMKARLKSLFDFCLQYNYPSAIMNFYQLYWAWDSLENYPQDQQFEWEGATHQNIESIVKQEARNWLKQHETVLQ